MSDSFQLSGGYTVTPQGSTTSFAANVEATIDESLSLKSKQVAEVLLSSDAPVAVQFGGVTNAHVVALKAVGGKVKAAITTADGAAQAVPFDSTLILMSSKAPVTAITITREPGVEATVRVFLGEKA